MTSRMKHTDRAAIRGGSILSVQADSKFDQFTDLANEYGRLVKVFVGWPWTPQRWISNSAVLMALSMGLWLMIIQVGWGDYGQWLMVSRAYLGQDVPEYRNVSAIPPVSPILIASITSITGNPIFGLQLFKGLLGFSLVISIYLSGTSIYNSRAAGLLAAVFALLVADRVLELFAFGGLPQLTALAFMIGSVGAAGRAARDAEPSWKWWSLAAALMTAAAASHVGTGLISVFSSGIIVAGVLAVKYRMTWRQRAALVTPFFIAGLAVLAYYLPVLLPVNSSYATNPASQEYRGPERIWAAYSLYAPNWAVIALGGIFLVTSLERMIRTRTVTGGYATVLWAGGVWLFLIAAIIAGSSTDYPRFTAPLIVPLAVAAGGGLASALSPLRTLLLDRYQFAARAIIPIGAAALIVISVGFDTAGQHSAEADFYALPELESVQDIANWLNTDEVNAGTVVASTRSAKWIEGLTGRSTLMEIPVRFSFREWELERSIANQTILKSSSILINEQFLVRFTGVTDGIEGPVPIIPWVGINHGGEYIDLLRLPPSTTRVFTGPDSDDLLATQGALEARTISSEFEGELLQVRAEWSGARRGSDVSLTRSFGMAANGEDFFITDTAISEIPITGIETEIWPINGSEFFSVIPVDLGVLISFPLRGSSHPEILVTADDPAVIFRINEDGLVATSTGDTLRLRYAVKNPGAPLHPLAFLTPKDVIERFNVTHVVLSDSDASIARAERLSASGFLPVYFSGPYTVLGMGEPVDLFPPSLGPGQPDLAGPDSGLPSGIPVIGVATPTPVRVGAPSEPTDGRPIPTPTAVPTPAPTSTPTPTPVPTPVPPPSELIDASLWFLERPELNSGTLLVASSADSSWIETLSGSNALALSADLASELPEIRREATIAEALLRSTTSLVNQNYTIKFIDSKSTPDEVVPRQLWAAGNIGGAYEALLRLLPAESKVLVADGDPGEVLATLNALTPTGVSFTESEEGIAITTTWAGERRGGTVLYSRTVKLSDGADHFEVTDTVSGTAPIGDLDVSIRPPIGKEFGSVEITQDSVRAAIAGTNGTDPEFLLAVQEGLRYEKRDRAIGVTTTTESSLTLQISLPQLSEPIAATELLVPADLVTEHSITVVMLRRDDAFSSREKRMNALGFTTTVEFGSLVVMTKEAE